MIPQWGHVRIGDPRSSEKECHCHRITCEALNLHSGRPIDYMPSIAEEAVGRVRGGGGQLEVEFLLELAHVAHTRFEVADGVR